MSELSISIIEVLGFPHLHTQWHVTYEPANIKFLGKVKKTLAYFETHCLIETDFANLKKVLIEKIISCINCKFFKNLSVPYLSRASRTWWMSRPFSLQFVKRIPFRRYLPLSKKNIELLTFQSLLIQSGIKTETLLNCKNSKYWKEGLTRVMKVELVSQLFSILQKMKIKLFLPMVTYL